jgi:hypothetical protein
MNNKAAFKQNGFKIFNKQELEGDEEDFNILSDVLKLIDSLFEMRLVEKLSRPMEKKAKE